MFAEFDFVHAQYSGLYPIGLSDMRHSFGGYT